MQSKVSANYPAVFNYAPNIPRSACRTAAAFVRPDPASPSGNAPTSVLETASTEIIAYAAARSAGDRESTLYVARRASAIPPSAVVNSGAMK